MKIVSILAVTNVNKFVYLSGFINFSMQVLVFLHILIISYFKSVAVTSDGFAQNYSTIPYILTVLKISVIASC